MYHNHLYLWTDELFQGLKRMYFHCSKQPVIIFCLEVYFFIGNTWLPGFKFYIHHLVDLSPWEQTLTIADYDFLIH